MHAIPPHWDRFKSCQLYDDKGMALAAGNKHCMPETSLRWNFHNLLGLPQSGKFTDLAGDTVLCGDIVET